MFLAARPSPHDIERFLEDSRTLPISYEPIGIVREANGTRRFDEQVAIVGHGAEDFARAQAALLAWKQFDMGWVEAFPHDARATAGTVVAVLIRHFGFWSLNGARVLYEVGGSDGEARFGYAYGTLTNHAEGGEELFEVFVEPRTADVIYRIRAISWPQTLLTRVGQPIVRALQARFRRDSAAAMRRATQRVSVQP